MKPFSKFRVLVALFISIGFNSNAQSKKEQIEYLNSKLDSLNHVVKLQKRQLNLNLAKIDSLEEINEKNNENIANLVKKVNYSELRKKENVLLMHQKDVEIAKMKVIVDSLNVQCSSLVQSYNLSQNLSKDQIASFYQITEHLCSVNRQLENCTLRVRDKVFNIDYSSNASTVVSYQKAASEITVRTDEIIEFIELLKAHACAALVFSNTTGEGYENFLSDEPGGSRKIFSLESDIFSSDMQVLILGQKKNEYLNSLLQVGYEWSASDLHARINSYNDYLLTVAKGECKTSKNPDLSYDLIVVLENWFDYVFNINSSKIYKPQLSDVWEVAHFNDKSLLEIISKLTSFQNEIRYISYTMMLGIAQELHAF